MKTIASLLCVLALSSHVLTTTASAAGGPPELLSYQGYLVDADGNPLGETLPSNYDVIFSIFDASSGGALRWREQQTITVDNGYFSVLLGEGTVVDSDPRPDLSEVFTGISAPERFIGVAVRFEAGAEFSDILPRLRLLSSPYAFTSAQARSLVGPDGSALITGEGEEVTIAGRLTTTQELTVPSIAGSGADLTNLNAGSITSGILPLARVPDLPASRTTSGTFHADRIPNLNASKITAGTLGDARLSDNVPRLNRSFNHFVHSLRIGTLEGMYVTRTEAPSFPDLNVNTFRFVANPSIPNLQFEWWHGSRHNMTLSHTGNLWIAGSFGHLSDRNRKQNIETLQPADVLKKVVDLPLYEWSYIGESYRHIGPMAQDFHAAFGLGTDETTLSPSDVAGVSVLAVQGLREIVKAQETEIAGLREAVAELQAAVETLREMHHAGQ